MFTDRWNRWVLTQSCLWLVLLSGAAVRPANFLSGVWLLGAAFVSALSFGRLWKILGSGRTVADWATLGRFAGLLAVTFAVNRAGAVTWATWTLYVFVVVADLFDGWLARRYGGSEEGAILDMETDQFTTLILACVALHAGTGPWVLGLPVLKYVFALGMRNVDGAQDPKPCDGDNRRARLVCASVMVLLLVTIHPASTALLRAVASASALAILSTSFAGDLRFLRRRAADSR